MDDASRRQELARFLRARRERLSPAETGLIAAGRRRTPGARREEIAQIAGISVSWYTWLEQGRAITVSTQVIESLARALRLTPEDRTHLFILARGELPVIAPPTSEAMDTATRQVLDAVSPYPAYAVNAHWRVVAWNASACQVFLDFAALPDCPERERNLLWLLFTQPVWRARYDEWESVARRMLALFRVSTAPFAGDAWRSGLIEDLSAASPEFQRWWPQQDVADSPRDAKVMNHPLVGQLRFYANPLQVARAPDAWMLIYTPVPETDTHAKVERLLAMSAQAAQAASHEPSIGERP
jgi:transcriptional regulator with XRE-family HTH domain